ncbi:MAG TPA: carboxypeptidase-like regulatory domain-containing protein [Aridibacter sp.]|nr:carboxypeptidase-like regulatory domain-containing protein [Aridibacter sp.]
MKRALIIPALAALLLAFATTVAAQDTGSIKGKVRTQKGKGIPGATITARKDGDNVKSVTADKDGDFRLSGLKPGIYNVVFEKEGYAGGVLYDIEVRRKKTNNLGDNLVLTVDQGTLVILEANVFTHNGFSLPGAKVKVEEVTSDGNLKEVAEGYSSRDGDVIFRFPDKETKYRVTATWRGISSFKEVSVGSPAIYRTAITIDISEKDN